MTVTRWWWIRHAPVPNSAGQCYGQEDRDSDTSDSASFAGLSGLLPGGAVLVTSDLRRTTQTAAAIAAAGLALPEAIVEPSLREQFFGDWQGMTHAEIHEERGEQHPFWLAPAYERPPSGESFADLLARLAPTVGRLTRDHAGRDIISVGHGGTVRAALSLALGLDPEAALAFTVENLSLTRLDHISGGNGGGAWRVVTVNQRPKPNGAA